MTSSGSVFSQTLQEITNTKLDELSKRRNNFEEAKSSLLAAVQVEQDAINRLRTLSAGVKNCFSIKLDNTGNVLYNHTTFPQVEVELKNLDRFLSQADYDPSLSTKTLDAWEQSLLLHLDTQSRKFQYASLYGQLVTEWLSSNSDDGGASSDDVHMGEPFEDVGSAQKLRAREEWEGMVFEAANVNETKLWNYLHGIFRLGDENKNGIQSALSQLQDAIHSFEASMSIPNQFNTTSLRWVIRGLWSSDLLSDEKREVLKSFEGNEILLGEIADVLNMRINALSSWTWSSEVEMRRKISGIYNIHMHEDLLQAIFLQYLGVKWSVFFKSAFQDFRQSAGAWTSTRKDIPKLDRQRLGYYLGSLESSPCLQSVRHKIYSKKYFMAQLMKHAEQDTANVEGEEEADYMPAVIKTKKMAKRVAVRPDRQSEKQFAGKRPRLSGKMARRAVSSAFMDVQAEVNEDDNEDCEEHDDSDEDDSAFNPMALKQNVLHLLSTEMAINTHLYGEMTAFHSVFESWNPLLPHETVHTVLKFLGVSEAWLGFFKKFLEAPVKFVDDDNSTPARKRCRGTPASHVLSDVIGEATLFCLDIAVNQATSGDVLWRICDDIWFWSGDYNVAVKAWRAVEEFNAMTGTKLNPEKTGTVRVAGNRDHTLPIDNGLPKGEIRWGFLRLSPQSGEFEIDQNMVDSHISELRGQLGKQNGSVLGFIHAWNTFAGTFFTSNFGKAGNCFGRKHVDNMLSTHERIQREIFASFNGDDGETVSSVAEYLKKALSSRFGFTDVPDGYLYFPTELGGLDLQSPFISLLQVRDEVIESSTKLFEDFKEAERKAYESAHAAFVNGVIKHQRYALDDPEWVPESARDRDVFMSFNEYVRYREYFKFDHYAPETRLDNVFHQLMQRPVERSVDPDSTKVWVALGQLGGQSNLRGITTNWHSMDPYWRWVAMMHGPEILDRFGSLSIVDSGLLPMGMISFFKQKRVMW